MTASFMIALFKNPMATTIAATLWNHRGVYFQNEFLVSKETVVLRRWERSKQKFGFIKRVDKGWITTVKDLERWRFER